MGGTYLHIHDPDMHINYQAHVPNFEDTFVSGTYFAITSEVEVEIRCVVGSFSCCFVAMNKLNKLHFLL